MSNVRKGQPSRNERMFGGRNSQQDELAVEAAHETSLPSDLEVGAEDAPEISPISPEIAAAGVMAMPLDSDEIAARSIKRTVLQYRADLVAWIVLVAIAGGLGFFAMINGLPVAALGAALVALLVVCQTVHRALAAALFTAARAGTIIRVGVIAGLGILLFTTMGTVGGYSLLAGLVLCLVAERLFAKMEDVPGSS